MTQAFNHPETSSSGAGAAVAVVVPPGFIVQEASDGTLHVVRSDERLTETLTVRIAPSERAALEAFFDTFPGGSVTAALRWLLADAGVQATMARRVVERRSA